MSIHRRAPRRDRNEAEIVRTLRALPGCTVLQLSGAGVPDLAVWYQGRWYLGEVKAPQGRRTTLQRWPDHLVPVWRTTEDALATLGVVRR